MAHYAKVSNGVVVNVIVAEADFFDTFVDDSPGEWIQTSYNTREGVHSLGGTPLRKNYASPGSIYDPLRDAFYSAKPYPSFVLDESTCLWNPPVGMPSTSLPDNQYYLWDEFTKDWVVKTRDNEWFSIVGLSTSA